jgi:hypothetical protein
MPQGKRTTDLDYRTVVYAPDGRAFLFPALLLAQLQLGNTRIAIPTFASRWVRFAQGLLQVDARGPVRILRVDTCALPFDNAGLVDREMLTLRTEFLTEAGNRSCRPTPAAHVIEARARFVLSRFSWSAPSQELQRLHLGFLNETIADFPPCEFTDNPSSP